MKTGIGSWYALDWLTASPAVKNIRKTHVGDYVFDYEENGEFAPNMPDTGIWMPAEKAPPIMQKQAKLTPMDGPVNEPQPEYFLPVGGRE